jgi:hypothetical protein
LAYDDAQDETEDVVLVHNISALKGKCLYFSTFKFLHSKWLNLLVFLFKYLT